jgi:hypothetical protein
VNKLKLDLLCDACCRLIPLGEDGVPAYFTDDAVCGGTDGPGFLLCGAEGCGRQYADLDVEARRKLFTVGRKRNDEARSQKAIDDAIEAMAVPVTVTISAAKLQNALVSAFESGHSYSGDWLKSVEVEKEPSRPCVYHSDVPFFGGELRVVMPDYRNVKGGKKAVRPITLASLQDAVCILADKYPHHATDLLADSGDVITGLVLVQCAIFGDILFE